MFEYIPDYDPAAEQRGNPKMGEVTTTGIVVGRGETQKIIDPEIVYKLASIGCNDREICDWLGVTESTLRFNFRGYMTKARSQLNQTLRRKQLQVALEGNPTLLIWLGKNILGQSESQITTEQHQVLPWLSEAENASEEQDTVHPGSE